MNLICHEKIHGQAGQRVPPTLAIEKSAFTLRTQKPATLISRLVSAASFP
ncbi:MAG TPA: hypothetical protein VK815_16685 [Candidatus Acidoferrales bacterium]|nr:hypothetical protein [Candidatus Acidoferrales bacterium]